MTTFKMNMKLSNKKATVANESTTLFIFGKQILKLQVNNKNNALIID